ncbi:4-hydroxy-2-oxoglutarate aldolase, mitochondrial-like [Haliotis rubra]|uniref:4-hydroxy-2-oxoglutarate aldolase, mitochondrial-like n=1 Tax=Haliotis rubra TaxID=36100 RepID=UPI001EE5007F|nr:4-hydroxy-2-oxoglutarate aldolase, mitochondrial-like [Haliotis rubra]
MHTVSRLVRAVWPSITARLYSSTSTKDISGIFPPIPTPFNADETIAWDKLESNIKKWNEIPLRGYVVQGSTGEYTFMTPQERVEAVRRVKDFAGPGKMVIAGSGCESTRDTINMTREMSSAGAEAVLVVTPCYYKGRMTSGAFIQHYTRVADDSPVPVILYSVPSNTGIDLPPDAIIQLAKHPNIIGIKESGGDVARIGSLVHNTSKDGFQVLSGSASFLYPALGVGSVGGVCALANVLGGPLCQLEQLVKEGKLNEAKLLQHRLIAPNAAVTKVYGIAGVKKAMEWFGFYGGPTRSPLQSLTEPEEKALRDTFVSSGFL